MRRISWPAVGFYLVVPAAWVAFLALMVAEVLR